MANLNDFFNRIEKLDQEDNLILRLVDARIESENMSLYFSLSTVACSDRATDERWIMGIRGVIEHQIILDECNPLICLESEHARLKARREPWVDLYFSDPPTRIDEFEYDLYKSHSTFAYGPFGSYGPYGNIQLGYGILASGPEKLMQDYSRILEIHGMRPSILPAITTNPRQPRKYGEVVHPETASMLNLSGDNVWDVKSFVIAKAFEAKRVR